MNLAKIMVCIELIPFYDNSILQDGDLENESWDLDDKTISVIASIEFDVTSYVFQQVSKVKNQLDLARHGEQEDLTRKQNYECSMTWLSTDDRISRYQIGWDPIFNRFTYIVFEFASSRKDLAFGKLTTDT